MLLALISIGNGGQPSDQAFIRGTAHNRQIVDWLVAYDRVAWVTSDEAMKAPKEKLKQLGRVWFCLEVDGRWHAFYGKQNHDQDVFQLVLQYHIDHEDKVIECDTKVDKQELDAFSRAMSVTSQKIRSVLRWENVRVNHYLRRLGDHNIEVWVLPAAQPDGTYVWGGEFRFVYSSDGRQELHREDTYTRFHQVKPKENPIIEIDNWSRDFPTVEQIFFLMVHGHVFERVTILNKHSHTLKPGGAMRTSLLHVQNERRKRGELIPSKDTGCLVFDDRQEDRAGEILWEGPCLDGVAQGLGRLTWLDGEKVPSVFEGFLKAGKEHGYGKYTMSSGDIVWTYWVDGAMTGPQTIVSTEHTTWGYALDSQLVGWWRSIGSDGRVLDWYQHDSPLANDLSDLCRGAYLGVKNLIDHTLAKGIPINLQGPDGGSALMCAVLANRPEVAAYLLEHGADGEVLHYGHHFNAYQLANALGNTDMMYLLSENKAADEINSDCVPSPVTLWIEMMKGWQTINESSLVWFGNEQTKELTPATPDEWYRLGEVYLEFGWLEQAEAPLTKAARAMGTAEAWNSLGYTLQGLKKVQAAKRAYERVLEIDPHHLSAKVNDAYLSTNSGDYQSAIVSFKDVLKQEPGYVNAATGLAQCYVLSGDTNAALQWIEEMTKDYPKQPIFWRVKSWVLKKVGRDDEAAQAQSRAEHLETTKSDD